MAKRSEPILGVIAPAPRPTSAALRLALLYVGLPLVGTLLIVDIAVWAIALAIWDTCIGVWCWL